MKNFARMVLVLLAISLFLIGSVKAEGNQSVSLVTYFDNENQVDTNITGLDYGAKVSVSNQLSSLENYAFYLWIYNGVIRPDLPLDYSFVVSSKTEIIGIFRPNNQYAAVFIDANGQLIDVQYVSPGGNATDIDSELLPDKPGYEIATNKWNKSLTNIQANTIFILQYQKVEASSYNLSVTGGTGSGSYGFNEYATIVADEPEMGMYFSYWKSNDKIVSYEPTHMFTVLDDLSLEAVYTAEPQMTLPLISLSGNLELRLGYHTYLGQFFLPEGYDLIEYGLITSSEEGIIDLGSSSIKRYQGSRYNPLTSEFVMSISEANLNSVRAYLVVKDELGNLRTFYDEYSEGEDIGAFAPDLFFSYYIEGSSNNKAFAVFNGTGDSVDLSRYKFQLFANGASSPTSTISLSGTLAHNQVYVVANTSANSTILSYANQTSGSVSFNGDDAFRLIKDDSIVVDIFGQVGVDPGTQWSANGVTTLDRSLKRKSSVTSGRVTNDAFDPSIEWDVYATDHSDGLNQHTMTGGSVPVTVTSIEAYLGVDTYEQGESIDLTGAFIKVFYSDGTSSVVSVTSEMVSSFSTSLVGTHSFAITYQGKSTSLYYVVTALTSSHSLMIFDIYGGGGNTGAIYKYDYVVLYNGSSSSINLSGYSMQYAPSTGSFSSILSLSGTIYSHTYYLIQLSSNNTSVGSDLPITPNISGSINMAATNGKVALAGKTTSISGSSDPDVIDFLGYGTANDYEGSAASGLTNTTSLKRNNYIDTDQNASDFGSVTANLEYLSAGLEVVSISVTNLPRYYEVSDPLVIGNAKVVLYYNNGSTEQIDLTSGMVSGFTTSTLGTYEMTMTYQGLTTQFEYYVIDYSAIDEVLVHYIDLGYLGGGPGESALIQIGGIDILIDAGENSTSSKDALMAFLGDVITDGVIEYVIATHQDADHIGGMDVVYAAYYVENTILYSTPSSIATSLRNSFEAIVEDEEGTIYYVYDIISESGIIDLTHGVSMVFYDTTYLTTANANASSIVFVLEAFNTRILFNGDAEGNQESVYAPLVGDVDIFKMGHHGAAAGTTTNLLNHITPEVAIVTNGNFLGNQFSHPTYDALARIYTYSNLVPVYSVTGGNGSSSDRMQERNGTITVTVYPSGYAIASEYYGNNPLELSATSYWNDSSNTHRALGYYYADATGLSEEAAIRYALNQIISGHTSISYSNLIVPMRSIYEDPNNSSNVLLFYTNRSQSKYTDGGGVDEWNREHVWAQSHGIDGAAPAYSDLHHIRPTDASVNSARGDLDFGVVSPHNSSTLVSDTYGDVLTYNYRSSSYFEPRDEIKGDVARILFYMVVRYEGYGSEPDLELVNGTTSSTSNNLGDLATLLLWHLMDPVDDAEREINNRIYQYQHNRNPFIDHPEWVDLIFSDGGSS